MRSQCRSLQASAKREQPRAFLVPHDEVEGFVGHRGMRFGVDVEGAQLAGSRHRGGALTHAVRHAAEHPGRPPRRPVHAWKDRDGGSG